MAYGYPYQMQQPVMPSYFNTNYAPPMPQMQQAPAANVTWIYVNGWDGARNQIVQPGQTAWMMDNNDPVIYIKAVDSMGSANLRAFKLTEIFLGAELRVVGFTLAVKLLLVAFEDADKDFTATVWMRFVL